jgi:transcriptional regulator with XRE-family HTH domain
MEQNDPNLARKRFGQRLRSWRERRRLSLDEIAALASTVSEPIGRSSIARFESGEVLPTLDRLSVLALALDVPFIQLAAQYEIENRLAGVKPAIEGLSPEEIMAAASERIRSGEWLSVLAFVVAAEDRFGNDPATQPDTSRTLKLREIDALAHLGYHVLAKVEVEVLLADPEMSIEQRLQAWQFFVMSCYRQRLFTVAAAGLVQAETLLRELSSPVSMHPQIAFLRAVLEVTMGNAEAAIAPYETAIRGFEEQGNRFQTCSARVSHAEALVALGHFGLARESANTAVREASEGGFDRTKALGLSTLALLSHRGHKSAEAERWIAASNEIAVRTEYWDVCFRNNWVLRQIARAKDDTKMAERCDRALRTYLSRVDPDLPEAREYKDEIRRHAEKGGSA